MISIVVVIVIIHYELYILLSCSNYNYFLLWSLVALPRQRKQPTAMHFLEKYYKLIVA